MAENKTKPTHVSVAAFIKGVEPSSRRADARVLDTLLRRVTGSAPKMWGPSIVGYGRYHYKYDSGREGEMCRIGFSPRQAALVLYIVDGFQGRDALLRRLGKHKLGKSCLYINTLSDVDLAALEKLAQASIAHLAEKYPD